MRLQQMHVPVLATLLLVLLSILHQGAAVICYQCNSEYDPRCGDPFDPYSLGMVNCSFQPRPEHLNSLEPTLCRKIRQKVYGKYRVVRGCGFVKDEDADNKECQRRSGTHDVNALYCSCNTDLCNSANTPHPSIGLMALLGFGSVLLLVTRIIRTF